MQTKKQAPAGNVSKPKTATRGLRIERKTPKIGGKKLAEDNLRISKAEKK